MDLQLRLRNHASVIGPAVDFTRTWGINAGLSEDRALRLALAVDELVTDIVRFAFPGEDATFEVTFRHDLSTAEVIVRERGEPFDPSRHAYDPEAAAADGTFDGAGFAVMRRMVDDFAFLNKGRQGKEFRLVQHIEAEHIADLEPADTAEEAADPEAVEYELRPAEPEDAEDIAKLIYRVYGYTYVKEDLYYPDRIERALESDEKFGVVVRTSAGRAVGYFAVLLRPDSRIGEVGEAVVDLKHRRRGLMTRMLKALIEEANERKLKGVFGEAVTAHTISQRVNARYDMTSTALCLALHRQERFRGLSEDYTQPVSVVIEFRPLVPYDTVVAYLPAAYDELLRRIYRELGAEVHTPGRGQDPRAGRPLPDEAAIDARIHYQFRHLELVVEQAGADAVEQVEQTVDDLEGEDMNAVFVDLPIDDPHTPVLTERLREAGFVLAGLMPRFHEENDHLRLQRPLADLGLDQVQVYSDLAHALKDRIADELSWNMSAPATS
jgi:anti-sigma regulatory factor (Ser/Thr protein kinase)/N-acetylglutamate synthase-like GNAT family acetyltransferase